MSLSVEKHEGKTFSNIEVSSHKGERPTRFTSKTKGIRLNRIVRIMMLMMMMMRRRRRRRMMMMVVVVVVVVVNAWLTGK
jgi:formate/nitrite transporter FocA (FNT family)